MTGYYCEILWNINRLWDWVVCCTNSPRMTSLKDSFQLSSPSYCVDLWEVIILFVEIASRKNLPGRAETTPQGSFENNPGTGEHRLWDLKNRCLKSVFLAEDHPGGLEGENFPSSTVNIKRTSDVRLGGHYSPSRAHQPQFSVTPAQDSSRLGWAFTVTPVIATRGEKGNKGRGWRSQCVPIIVQGVVNDRYPEANEINAGIFHDYLRPYHLLCFILTIYLRKFSGY